MLKNKWSFVLLTLFLVFSLILISQCQSSTSQKKWRYEIKGFVNYKGKKHPAIWYTDTVEYGDNYVMYSNSDGTEVVIPAPYILKDYEKGIIKEDTSPAFE